MVLIGFLIAWQAQSYQTSHVSKSKNVEVPILLSLEVGKRQFHHIIFVKGNHGCCHSRRVEMLSVYDDVIVKSKINNLHFFFNFGEMGTSLVVQWLRLCAPNAGGRGLIQVRELKPTCFNQKSHMLQ